MPLPAMNTSPPPEVMVAVVPKKTPMMVPDTPVQFEVLPLPAAQPSGRPSPEVRPETTVLAPLSAPPARVILPPFDSSELVASRPIRPAPLASLSDQKVMFPPWVWKVCEAPVTMSPAAFTRIPPVVDGVTESPALSVTDPP